MDKNIPQINPVANDSVDGPRCGVSEMAPPDVFDAVIETYKRDVDRSLLVKNLSLTPAQRAEKLVDFMRFLDELRSAGRTLPPQGR